MMRGLIVFITAIFSIIFLKRVLYRHHYTGMALIVGGIALVGLAVVLSESDAPPEPDDKSAGLVIVGICLLIGS